MSCKQRREKEHVRARDFGREARGERVLGGELAARERAQPIDRGDRVNVDRVRVVHVVVHAPDDRRKLGDHRHEQAHVVELLQHRSVAQPRALHHRAEPHEEPRRFLARAQRLAERRLRDTARTMASRAKAYTGKSRRTASS